MTYTKEQMLDAVKKEIAYRANQIINSAPGTTSLILVAWLKELCILEQNICDGNFSSSHTTERTNAIQKAYVRCQDDLCGGDGQIWESIIKYTTAPK